MVFTTKVSRSQMGKEIFPVWVEKEFFSWSPNWWSCACSASVCARISAFNSSLLGSGRNKIATPPMINPNKKATSVLMSPSSSLIPLAVSRLYSFTLVHTTVRPSIEIPM
jgi:hypothetical protein